jgi:ubiquitin-conjugating enzyme E2 T
MEGGRKVEKCRLGPQALTRLQRELRMLEREPPPGVSAWPKDENRIDVIEAVIQGPPDTVYEDGFFHLNVTVPSRYPFEPPSVQFSTPIYHPNIDSCGRICLDTLNMPPKGAWKPSINIPTVLSTVRLLLEHPNPDDGLMTEITDEYKYNRELFDTKARKSVSEHARRGAKQAKDAAAIQSTTSTSGGKPTTTTTHSAKQIQENAGDLEEDLGLSLGTNSKRSRD